MYQKCSYHITNNEHAETVNIPESGLPQVFSVMSSGPSFISVFIMLLSFQNTVWATVQQKPGNIGPLATGLTWGGGETGESSRPRRRGKAPTGHGTRVWTPGPSLPAHRSDTLTPLPRKRSTGWFSSTERCSSQMSSRNIFESLQPVMLTEDQGSAGDQAELCPRETRSSPVDT